MVQLESAARAGTDPFLRILARLPFVQLEPLAVCAALFAVATVARGWLIRWGVWLIHALLQLLLVMDHVYFGIYRTHLNLSAAEGRIPSLGLLFDSFVGEVDTTALLNLILAVSSIALAAVWTARVSGGLRSPLRRLTRARLGATLLVVGASLVGSAFLPGLPHDGHPLFHLRLGRDTARTGTARAVDPGLFRPRFGVFEEQGAEREQIVALRERVAQLPSRPNVILVMLESVGAHNLFRSRQLPTSGAPALALLARNAIVFDTLYTTFPGTLRAHVGILTGGRIFTAGSTYTELEPAYAGPTLVGQLRSAGYRTAMISPADQTFEGGSAFYRRLGYDRFLDFTDLSGQEQEAVRLNSYGGRDDAFFERAHDWIREGDAEPAPWFLFFPTLATHHPYSIPGGFAERLDRTTAEDHYLRALSYLDRSLGRFLAALQSDGLLDGTIVVLFGDHGEAFGKTHSENWIHNNYLYETNLRTFLMITDPRAIDQGPVFSGRIGTLGDVMPTLLSYLGVDPGHVLGQDLLSPDYALRTVFFHKATLPPLLGLRDGRWKFIAPLEPGAAPVQLYDLGEDPWETRNLAAERPARVESYRAQARGWFSGIEADFRQFSADATVDRQP